MKFDFDEKLNNFIKIIVKNAQIQKIRVFFAGGAVRDYILNVPIKDIDILVEGDAIEFSKKLPEDIKIKSIHKDFGTVKVEFCGIEFDIASTRSEKYPYSGCLPCVEKIGVPIEIDVKRRDFTVNSLYCELSEINNEIKFELLDYTKGLEDISKKTLRVLHKNSYKDDPTRILRGLDFKYRFGFDFSNDDKKLVEKSLLNFDYKNMSIDRAICVLNKILNSEHGVQIFKELIEKKYYKIFPDFFMDDASEVIKIKDIFSLNNAEFAEFCTLIVKNFDIAKVKTSNILEIYKTFSKFSKYELAYYFYKTSDNNVLLFNKIAHINLNIKGGDLISLNYKQGKLIGEILDKLLKEKLKNPALFQNKEAELNWVQKNFPLK